MFPMPPPNIKADIYFGRIFHLKNHLLLHEYWVKVMRSKGAELDNNDPAYLSPFFEEGIRFPKKKGLCHVKDDALGEYVEYLKKAIDEADPSPEGRNKFEEFMRKFFISLPSDIVYELHPTGPKYKGVCW